MGKKNPPLRTEEWVRARERSCSKLSTGATCAKKGRETTHSKLEKMHKIQRGEGGEKADRRNGVGGGAWNPHGKQLLKKKGVGTPSQIKIKISPKMGVTFTQ